MKKSKEPGIFLPKGISYQCLLCGKCCGVWKINIDAPTYHAFKKSWFYKNLQEKYPQLNLIDFNPQAKSGFINKLDNECIMLEKGLCSIHSNLGSKAKPHSCRMFPFVMGVTDRGIYVGVSYHCPAIAKNSGVPIEDHLPDIKEIIKDGKFNTPPQYLKLTPDLEIDWDGYFIIEKFINDCIDNNGTLKGTWDAMSSIAAFHLMKKSSKIQRIKAGEIKDFFKIPPPAIMKRDDSFNEYQMSFTASMITILELWEKSMKNEFSNTIFDGGIIDSDTFEKEIEVKPFRDYLQQEIALWDEPVFIEYIRHLLWRKHLLIFDTIFSAVTALHFKPLLFCWYSNVSAISNGKEAPNLKDFRNAMGIIDLYFHHLRNMNRFFEKFATEILEQPGFFFDCLNKEKE